MKVTAASLSRAPVPRHEMDDSHTRLDSKEFALYCLRVRKAITGEASIADIKRALPDDDHRLLFDAIEQLEGVGSIRQTKFVAPQRWAIKDLPVAKVKRQFNGNSMPRDLSLPDPRSFSIKRRGRSY